MSDSFLWLVKAIEAGNSNDSLLSSIARMENVAKEFSSTIPKITMHMENMGEEAQLTSQRIKSVNFILEDFIEIARRRIADLDKL